jgi:hypothetical protein
MNIYEYDFDAPPGERIVRVSSGALEPEILEVLPYTVTNPVVSEDGSHVYFLAKGVLTNTPNGEGETAEAGAPNLYMFERDTSYPSGRVAFVARLSPNRWEIEKWAEVGGETDHAGKGGNATPDGDFLVLSSERDLTPDDTSKGVQQLFEYDAQTGSLVRISIGQDGFNNNGNIEPIYNPFGQVDNNAEIATPISYYKGIYKPSAYWSGMTMSVNGEYVFFESPVGLTPQAVNDKVIGTFVSNGNLVSLYAHNVYEYHDGRVSLISDGQDFSFYDSYSPGQGSEVQLLGTDESGANVLFKTTDRLVGQDTDTNTDIYDARIDGGFPAPAEPPPCSGESCQGQLSGAPTLLSPGSEFQAGGNPPLAGEPAPKSKTPKKAKPKSKKSGLKGRKAGKRRAKRRGSKAKRAAVGGRPDQKGGRS